MPQLAWHQCLAAMNTLVQLAFYDDPFGIRKAALWTMTWLFFQTSSKIMCLTASQAVAAGKKCSPWYDWGVHQTSNLKESTNGKCNRKTAKTPEPYRYPVLG
jgi:hypothetical protein